MRPRATAHRNSRLAYTKGLPCRLAVTSARRFRSRIAVAMSARLILVTGRSAHRETNSRRIRSSIALAVRAAARWRMNCSASAPNWRARSAAATCSRSRLNRARVDPDVCRSSRQLTALLAGFRPSGVSGKRPANNRIGCRMPLPRSRPTTEPVARSLPTRAIRGQAKPDPRSLLRLCLGKQRAQQLSRSVRLHLAASTDVVFADVVGGQATIRLPLAGATTRRHATPVTRNA